MADDVEVSCISKKMDGPDPHERIRGIGGIHRGKHWWLSQADAISGIEEGRWNFYIPPDVPGAQARHIIVAVYQTQKYLKTDTDDLSPDNLLRLRECPLISS